MIATITITRRDQRNEDRDFLVDVTRDRDGDIWATCGEDVAELRTTNRHGSIETYPTGRLFQRRGEPIELEDDELDEAEAALTQLEALWQAERARLKEIFAPVAETSAFRASPIFVSEDTEDCGLSVDVPREDDRLDSSAVGSENESGFGRFKNAQARSDADSSEAMGNPGSPGDPVKPVRSLPRHDLLNSRGIDIALPPGVGAEVSEPEMFAVEGLSNHSAAHE